MGTQRVHHNITEDKQSLKGTQSLGKVSVIVSHTLFFRTISKIVRNTSFHNTTTVVGCCNLVFFLKSPAWIESRVCVNHRMLRVHHPYDADQNNQLSSSFIDDPWTLTFLPICPLLYSSCSLRTERSDRDKCTNVTFKRQRLELRWS